ncbi:hypothetical protein TNCV_1124501 [Trichonephila clavipes]|uniref:Uncharacterized protein n=1 Tax=Trichonephila clavipes TaxID=2585209 RepID=A0A8X6VKE4_TRICX|nr:hypothetical protein TNCV_1124501 [Trichonephila clavipes]
MACVCIQLTAADCLQWCQEHKDWASHQQNQALFTKESHFRLSNDSKPQLVWKVTVGAAESHDIADHIMIGPPSFLTVGGRQSRAYACSDVL